MKRRLVLMFIGIMISVGVAGARTIRGQVLSAVDSTAVGGARCVVSAAGSNSAGCMTDASGLFSIDTDVKSALTLEISMTGFSPTQLIVESGHKNINAGTIYLDPDATLGEVTVTTDAVIQSRGRTIVYPSVSEVKASSTSISLFQKLPLAGLEANPINRTITVDGGTPVILVNGVPSSLEEVNALQPKDIEKIEYSRFTPARYADRGGTGFINITLKRRTDGGQFYAWGRSAVSTAFVDGNIRSSYHQGQSQFTLSYNSSWRNYQSVYDYMTQSYIGDDFRVNLKENDRNPFNYLSNNIRLKYDYSPTLKTLFSATFTASPSSDGRRNIAHSYDSELGEYNYHNRSKGKSFAPSLDLFLRHEFNDRNTLEVQVVGTLSSSDYRRNNTYFFGDGTDESYIMNVDSRRRSLISEISYTHSFSDKTELSAGYQNTQSYSTNTYIDSDYKPVLTESNNYAYVRLGQSIGKVYVSLATGAKLFWIHNDVNKRRFIRNLSSARVSWNINRSWSLQAAFGYTPSIPSLTSLTDYAQQTSPYLISNGNPDLKSDKNFQYVVAANYTVGKFSASLQSTYYNSVNAVAGDVSYLGDGLFLSQSVNLKHSRLWNNSLTLVLRQIHGFGANVRLGLGRYEAAGEQWSHTLTSFSGSMTIWWSNGPFTVAYWRKLPGKYLNGHYVGRDENGDALQFEYTPDKHWTIGASWMYMFDRKGTRYPSWNYSEVNPSFTDRYIKDNSNMVVLSVSYSADFGSIFRTARRNLNNSDNGSSLLKL